MSFKVVRDASGKVLGFGPNDDGYGPNVPAGGSVSVEQAEPSMPVVVPKVVTMRQARLALLASGKLSQVDAVIDSLSEPHKSAARIEWDYSSEVQRDKPFVVQIGAALGLTSEQLDQLFVEASKL